MKGSTPMIKNLPDQWYYIQDKKRVGPIRFIELRERQLKPTDMVLQQGSQRWVEVKSVTELGLDTSVVSEAASQPPSVSVPFKAGVGLTMACFTTLKEAVVATAKETKRRIVLFARRRQIKRLETELNERAMRDFGDQLLNSNVAVLGAQEVLDRFNSITEAYSEASQAALAGDKQSKREAKRLARELGATYIEYGKLAVQSGVGFENCQEHLDRQKHLSALVAEKKAQVEELERKWVEASPSTRRSVGVGLGLGFGLLVVLVAFGLAIPNGWRPDQFPNDPTTPFLTAVPEPVAQTLGEVAQAPTKEPVLLVKTKDEQEKNAAEEKAKTEAAKKAELEKQEATKVAAVEAAKKEAAEKAEQTPKESKEEILYKGKPASFWIRQLKDRDVSSRLEAIKALREIGTEAEGVVPVILAAMNDTEKIVQDEARAAFGGFPLETRVSVLLKGLKSDDSNLRSAATRILDELGLPKPESVTAETIKEGFSRKESKEKKELTFADFDDYQDRWIDAFQTLNEKRRKDKMPEKLFIAERKKLEVGQKDEWDKRL